MLDYRLDKQELVELRATHRKALNVREAYRINAVILLGNGRTAADVPARCCLILVPFVSILSTTGRGGLEALLCMNDVGSDALLDKQQLA